MNTATRQELLTLIEALCEGTLTDRQRQVLEYLVLHDPDCRSLYVRAMELHGLLHWDAGGIGSLAEMPVRREPASPPRRTRRGIAVLAGLALTLAIAAGVFVLLPEQQLARHDPSAPPEQAGEFSPVPAELPKIQLSPLAEAATSPEPKVVAAPLESDPAVLPPVTGFSELDLIVDFINQQVRQGWEESGVQPVARASDSVWMRRVYLDMAGRIPTRTEARKFLESPRPDKRKRLVLQLAKTPDFARHQATVWTSLMVRRTDGGQSDRGALLDWMTAQYRADRPWQEVITELVTARGTPSHGPANFLLAHLNNQAVPATAVTARIFLCQQLQCAQCHTHPLVKEWGQDRFWEVNAFFQQVRIRQRAMPEMQGKRSAELVDLPAFGPTFYETLQGVMQVAYPEFAGVEIMKDPRRPLREQFAELLTSDPEHQVARAFVNRTWGQYFGRAFTHPLDDMGPHNPPSHPELLDGLTRAFVASGYSMKLLSTAICLSEPYQCGSELPPDANFKEAEADDSSGFQRILPKPLSAEQIYDSLQIASGASPRELVPERESASGRAVWLRQFYSSVETEENGESTTLDGSIPQVLMMMNGELTSRATGPETGRLLADVLANPKLTESEKISELSLAALTRLPDASELSRLKNLVHRQVRLKTEQGLPAPAAVEETLRDLYWAYLNSSEFAIVH